MYTIIVFVLIGIVVALVLTPKYMKECRKKGEVFYDFNLSSCIYMPPIFGLFIGLCVGLLGDFYLPLKKVELGPDIIVGMRSSDNVSGNFVFGTGSISGGMTYHFYARNADNTISPRQLWASPLVKIEEDATIKDIGYWTTVKLVRDDTHWLYNWTLERLPEEIIEQRLRVPAGTVQLTFKSQ